MNSVSLRSKLLTVLAVVSIIWLITFSSRTYAAVINSSVDCNVVGFIPNFDNCSGAYVLEQGENDVTNRNDNDVVSQLLNQQNLFGNEDWTFLGKQDTDLANTFFNIESIDQSSGTITFDVDLFNQVFGGDFFTDYDLVISLKAGQYFSLYQWDSGLDTNVFYWTTSGVAVNNDNPKDLSHGSVYIRDGVVHVSEPRTSSLLLISGLLLLMYRRNKLQSKA